MNIRNKTAMTAILAISILAIMPAQAKQRLRTSQQDLSYNQYATQQRVDWINPETGQKYQWINKFDLGSTSPGTTQTINYPKEASFISATFKKNNSEIKTVTFPNTNTIPDFASVMYQNRDNAGNESFGLSTLYCKAYAKPGELKGSECIDKHTKLNYNEAIATITVMRVDLLMPI